MSFKLEHTNITKGLAIILMIFHHCFLDVSRYQNQSVIFLLPESFVNTVSVSFKVCVAIFVFLSAYGLTVKYKKESKEFKLNPCIVNAVSIPRIIKLLGGYQVIFSWAIIVSLMIDGFSRIQMVYGSMGNLFGNFVIDFFGLAEAFHTPTFLATFWYISLAIILVVITPFLLLIYKKYGAIFLLFSSVLFSLFFPISNVNHYCYLSNFLFSYSLGIVFADKDLFKALSDIKLNKILKLIMLTICYILFVGLWLKLSYNNALYSMFIGLETIIIIWFVYEYICKSIICSTVLRVIGKHSMNIFLIHNFIRVVWMYDFTYSFKYPILIVLVLLIISLALSIIIEFLKKKLRYDSLINYLIYWVLKHVKMGNI